VTLIFSLMGPQLGLIALSDILTSYGDPSYAEEVELPMRVEPKRWANEKYGSAGTAQKTVIVGRTMVQWAGSKDAAEKVIKVIAARSNQGDEEVDLVACVEEADLSSTSRARLALIYHFRLDRLTCKRSHVNCAVVDYAHGSLIVAGSGRDDFMFNVNVIDPEKCADVASLARETFSKLNSVFIENLKGDDSYNDAYGGWLEFTTCTSDGFSKVPYALKAWEADADGRLSPYQPLFFSMYVGSRLCISRVKFEVEDARIVPRPSVVVIPDFLGRMPPAGSEPPNWGIQPGVMTHVVIDLESDITNSLSFQSPEPFGYEMYQRGGDISMHVEGWLTESLARLGENAAPISVEH
jgi:hypothetical protein